MSTPKDSAGQPSVNFTLPESRVRPIGAPLSIYETIIAQGITTGSSKYTPEQALHRPVPLDDASNELSLGHLTRKSLPYFMPWNMTAGPEQVPPDFSMDIQQLRRKSRRWCVWWGCDGSIDGCIPRSNVRCNTSSTSDCRKGCSASTTKRTSESYVSGNRRKINVLVSKFCIHHWSLWWFGMSCRKI